MARHRPPARPVREGRGLTGPGQGLWSPHPQESPQCQQGHGGLSPHSLGLLPFCAQTVTCHGQRPGPLPGHTRCPGGGPYSWGSCPAAQSATFRSHTHGPLRLRVSLLLCTPTGRWGHHQRRGLGSTRGRSALCAGPLGSSRLPACRSGAASSGAGAAVPFLPSCSRSGVVSGSPCPTTAARLLAAGPPRGPGPARPLRDTPSPAPSQSPGEWPL